MAVRSMLPRNACFCLALLAAAFAGTEPASQETVRVTTRLVEVSVVAETKNGDPVSDLTQEDFTILDQGRAERIAVFTRQRAQEREPTSRPLPPNVFSNRFERLGKAPTSATVVLFDGLNTELTDQAYARQQIVKFLEQLEPGDQVALYVLGRGPRILQDFTSDSNSLLKALENFNSMRMISRSGKKTAPGTAGWISGSFSSIARRSTSRRKDVQTTCAWIKAPTSASRRQEALS